ncbi:MAG TPA: hypothetical protein DIW64_22750 [Cellvibrio sp.]|nr:hypothetical protein [Cellvibrio sp.]
MNIKIKSILAGAVLGAVIYHVAAFFILGYTAAIVLPGSIANWAAENSARFPVMFMWDLLVVQLLGIGILSALATYLMSRTKSFDWLYLAIGFLSADIILSLASLLALPSLKYVSVADFIGWSPHFIVVFLCVFISARLGSKKPTV